LEAAAAGDHLTVTACRRVEEREERREAEGEKKRA